MAINFPSNPTQYQTFTLGLKTWVWNGYAWDLQTANTAPIISLANSAYTQANTALSLANSAYAKANTGGSGGGLTPTSIQTSSYIAVKNDLVRCNTTNGGFSITFPASPTDGDVIGVVDIANQFANNTLTILSNGKYIEGDNNSLILDINGASVSFVFSTATSNWKLLQTSISTNVASSGGGGGSSTTVSTGFETNFLLMGA